MPNSTGYNNYCFECDRPADWPFTVCDSCYKHKYKPILKSKYKLEHLPIKERVRALRKSGWSLRAISREFNGMCRTTIYRHLNQ